MAGQVPKCDTCVWLEREQKKVEKLAAGVVKERIRHFDKYHEVTPVAD